MQHCSQEKMHGYDIYTVCLCIGDSNTVEIFYMIKMIILDIRFCGVSMDSYFNVALAFNVYEAGVFKHIINNVFYGVSRSSSLAHGMFYLFKSSSM